MIVVKTPFRISFFGGATDYPKWYRENGGQVLATSIDKYCYVSCRKVSDCCASRFRLAHHGLEQVDNIADIEHSTIREAIQLTGVGAGLDMNRSLDLLTGAGLGSSSSFSVGLLHGLRALQGELSSPEELTRLAIHLEQDLVKEDVGSQDQVLAAHGGFNKVTFDRSGAIKVNPVQFAQTRKQDLNDHLMLFFTGKTRRAAVVAKSKIENLQNEQGRLFEMAGFVDEGLKILQDSGTDLSEFGRLLDESWQHKRMLSPMVSSDAIDDIYSAAKQAGALGGKLLGAGGGGFILLFVPPAQQTAVRTALGALTHVPFAFSDEGSKIVAGLDSITDVQTSEFDVTEKRLA